MEFIQDEIEEAVIDHIEREECKDDIDREDVRDIDCNLEERVWEREREREYERERYDDSNFS
jgi:hypothetical protein